MKYQNIRRILLANRTNVLYLFILSVLLMLPSTVSPMFRKVFTDQILTGNESQWMPLLFLLMIGVALFSAVSVWLQSSCLLRLSNKIEISGTALYFWKLLSSPLSFFGGKDSFILLSQMNASRSISRIITRDIINLIFSIISVIFYLIMMLGIDPGMTAVVLLLVILNFVIIKLKNKLSEKLSGDDDSGIPTHELQQQEERISSETLQNIETYKSTASETFFFQRLMGNKTAIINSQLGDNYEEAYSALEDFPEILFLNLLLIVFAMRIMDRELTIGTYLAFQAYASAFFNPMNKVLELRSTLRGYDKKVGRLNQTLQLPEQEEDTANDQTGVMTPPARLSGNIEFRNVSFEYEDGKPVIENLNLRICPGERIAIIGQTGAGKTTLLKLLLGLYQPTSGSVTIDGQDVNTIDQHLLANDIGCASQEIALFTDTIRNNITLWDESLTGSDVYRAASMAGLHEYITSLDHAYDSVLQENGSNLSGGQKQKLEIARAFLYDPTIIIFDEALRSVDQAAAYGIEEEIIKKASTYIEVTHILSRHIAYDRIIVLEQGRITAAGSHAELLQNSSYYAKVFELEGVYAQ